MGSFSQDSRTQVSENRGPCNKDGCILPKVLEPEPVCTKITVRRFAFKGTLDALPTGEWASDSVNTSP